MSERAPISPRSPRAALEPEQVPPPPKRSERARNPFIVVGNAIITILILAMIVVGGGYFYGKQKLEAAGPLQQDKIVNIPARAGMGDISDTLIREGVIENNRWAFIGAVLALKARSDLKPGEYAVPEGREPARRHCRHRRGQGGAACRHHSRRPDLRADRGAACPTTISLPAPCARFPREGTLLPETYKFPRGTTRDQVLQRMQQTQKRVLAEIWERRNPDIPIKSPEQLVVLASIVEKETGRADERSRVAAVFTNRLRQKIKLQSDPTIIYGLVGGKGTLGRPIKRSEITQPSPYNTYVIEGLPPGPIANPGRASLEAAANPARTRDLFFVADGSGGHTFTETYDAHQKNVAKLRAMEKQIQNDTVEPADEPAPAAAAAGAPAAATGDPTATTKPPAAKRPARGAGAGCTRPGPGPAGRCAIDDAAALDGTALGMSPPVKVSSLREIVLWSRGFAVRPESFASAHPSRSENFARWRCRA